MARTNDTTALEGGRGDPASPNLDAQLDTLAKLEARKLRAAWRRLYRTEPPSRLSRDLLIRGIAYKIQERAHGGSSTALKRRLRGLAERLAAGNDIAGSAQTSLRPGARLVREWRGTTHTVTVLEDGFDHDGKRYRSLSRIAKAITGAHWSGPRFFGLTRAPGNGDAPGSLGPDDSIGSGG